MRSQAAKVKIARAEAFCYEKKLQKKSISQRFPAAVSLLGSRRLMRVYLE